MLNLDDLTQDNILNILAACSRSTKLTAQLLFPDRFYSEFSPNHDKIFDLIDSGAPKIAIAAPRGIGKTSIVGLALAGRKILFQQCRFLAYVSQSSSSAELQTENLKRALSGSTLIKTLFGSIKAKNLNVDDEMFSKRAWVARVAVDPDAMNPFSTLVYPRGSGQQIRGVLYNDDRPDLIIVDDLEESKTITSDEIREKRKEWFYADLLKCVSRVKKNWQIVYIDTLKHEDALLQGLIDDPDWESVRLELCDDNLQTNFPTMATNEEIKIDYEMYKRQGKLDTFYRENRNLPISKEDASFKQEYFKDYSEIELGKNYKAVRDLFNVVIVDPAKTVKLQSADSAIVGLGISRSTRKIYVRDVVSDKFYPEQLYDESLEMVKRLKSNILAVEVTSLNEFIKQPFKNQMRLKNIMARWISLEARASKEERIAALVPYYRQGFIYHNDTCCTKLESQLLGFPRSKLWDVMDALAYVVILLEKFAHYFEPEEDEEQSPEEIEAEFEELDNEKLVTGWRIC